MDCESQADLDGTHIFVMPGAHDARSGRRIKTQPIVHPQWLKGHGQTLDSYEFDIALLITENEMEFGKHLRPVCLPKPGEISKNGILAGWGKAERLGDWLLERNIKYDDYDLRMGFVGEKIKEFLISKFPTLKGYLYVKDHILTGMFGHQNITIYGEVVMTLNSTKDADKIKNGMFQDILKSYIGIGKEAKKVFNQPALDAVNITHRIRKYQNVSNSIKEWFMKMNDFGGDLIFGLRPIVGTPKHASVGLKVHRKCTSQPVKAFGMPSYMICNTQPTKLVDGIPAGAMCQGDSGGPTMIKTDSGFVVVGVNSHTLPPRIEFMRQCYCDCEIDNTPFQTDVRQVNVNDRKVFVFFL